MHIYRMLKTVTSAETLQGLASPGALMKGLIQLLILPPWEAAGKVQSCCHWKLPLIGPY